jgi:hypothetical protein
MNFTLAAAGLAEMAEGNSSGPGWALSAWLLLPAVVYLAVVAISLPILIRKREPAWVWLSITLPAIAWIGVVVFMLA